MKGTFFNADFFAGETPWFGPFFGRYRSVLSNPGHMLEQDVEYRVIGWVFDEHGEMRGERDLGMATRARSITLDFGEAFPDLTNVRGCVALLICPNRGRGIKPISHDWTQYLFDGTTLVGILNSGNPVNINHPTRTGRKGQYRMVSPELALFEGWRPISSHSNVSADPSYSRSVEFEIVAYNESGEALRTRSHAVAPFGTAWVDLMEVFGGALDEHLKPSGRGSYTVACPDGAAVGYHFLYNPATGALASDHTRPPMKYLNMAYGAPAADTTFLKRLRAAASVLKFRLVGSRQMGHNPSD